MNAIWSIKPLHVSAAWTLLSTMQARIAASEAEAVVKISRST
ncbi:hypothetical protein [Cupriavidus pampae]|uniref:Uncharacterized protein n=1 Tax=Cupriavidus pampae TaxID=659251 RepID=A0ABN7ZLE5_9BURK|nr:hypothetical protein [Cupriavidus pampae]CAG9185002.1 hypothetical protein LMG32289_05822 [Cupriavidus pampae]